MLDYQLSLSWRGYGLAAASLATLALVATSAPLVLAAPRTAASKPVQSSVEITYIVGSPISVLPDKAALLTTWITPQGYRGDEPNGNTLLQSHDSPLVYELDTKAKTVTPESADNDSLIPLNPDEGWHDNAIGKVTMSHQSLLGYPCLVRKGVFKIGGRDVSLESWAATVAGRRVALKTVMGDHGTFLFVEAISVRVGPPPPGLLDIPAGYTVVAQKAATP